MGYPCTIYSWPTPAIKGRSSLQKGRSLSTADQHQLKRWERSYSTAGQHQLLRGEQKKLRPAQPPTPPPHFPFYHLERTPMLYLPPVWGENLFYSWSTPAQKGRYLSTDYQHQLKRREVVVLFREVRPPYRCRCCGVKIDSACYRISSKLCVTKTQYVFCATSEL